MPWYKTGTVSVTQNSNAVIGTSTAFIANARVGDALRGPDGGWYEVTNIASDTAMSISPKYQGATNTSGAYALAPMQGYVKDSADALRALVNQFGGVLAVLGETSTQAGVRTALNLTNTDGLPEGDTNKYFTNPRVLAVPMTGIDLSTPGSVIATDTLVKAIGKLQASKADLAGVNKTVAITQGGTGAATAAEARTNLGLGPVATLDVVPVSSGGTGGGTAATARAGIDAAKKGDNSDISSLSSLVYARVGGSVAPSGQGMYLMWNTGIGSISGSGDFVNNIGAGIGGFTWRSTNANNTQGGPILNYTYAGALNVPGPINQSSDARLKRNLVAISGGLEKVSQLRAVEYERRDFLDSDEYPHVEAGLIAQETFEVLPLVVTPADPSSESDVWRINYQAVVPYLIAAIQELSAQVDALKDKRSQ